MGGIPSTSTCNSPPESLIPGPNASTNAIILRCGNDNISTTRRKLNMSPVWNEYLKRHSTAEEVVVDGLYSIACLKHLLQYLHDPDTFPLLWNKENGFDFAAYQDLEQGAHAWQLSDLEMWIAEQRYLEAIKTVTTESVVEILPEQLAQGFEHDGDTDVQVHVLHKTRYFHHCAAGKLVHRTERGKPVQCGQKCKIVAQQAEDTVRYEVEPHLEIVTLTKKVVFDREVCKRQPGVRDELVAAEDDDVGYDDEEGQVESSKSETSSVEE